MKATERILKTLLDLCCDPQGPAPGAKRYVLALFARTIRYKVHLIRFLTGSRFLETHFYKPLSYPFDLVAPITVMWKPPDDPLPNAEAAPTLAPMGGGPANGSKRKKKNKGKGKGKDKDKEIKQVQISEADVNTLPPDMNVFRTVWIRIHPAAFDDILAALQTASSLALQTIRRDLKLQTDKVFEVEIADLRGQLNAFEIMGPKSSQVIKGALVPVGDDQREEFKKVCRGPPIRPRFDVLTCALVLVVLRKLTDDRFTTSWHGNWLQSPRPTTEVRFMSRKVDRTFMIALSRFPPANAKPKVDASKDAALAVLPSVLLAQSEIWDSQKRDGLKVPRYKKKDLDERRSKVLTGLSDSFSWMLISSTLSCWFPVLVCKHRVKMIAFPSC